MSDDRALYVAADWIMQLNKQASDGKGWSPKNKQQFSDWIRHSDENVRAFVWAYTILANIEQVFSEYSEADQEAVRQDLLGWPDRQQ